MHIQVCHLTESTAAFERERSALLAPGDALPKVIVSLEQAPPGGFDANRHISTIELLSGPRLPGDAWGQVPDSSVAGRVLDPRDLWYTFYTVDFESDPDKSRSNRLKHGVDSTAGRAIWDDPDVVEIPARTTDEPRFVVIGRIAGKHWSAVVTHRRQRVRIISIRRS